MPAPLSLSRTSITRDVDDVLDGVSILVRGKRATVRRGRTVLDQREDVAAVTAQSSSLWQVSFDDGASWLVKRARGCGCGG